jgi:hypothetical protein
MLMRMRMALAVAIAVPLTTAACSLLTSTDGLSGGAADASAPTDAPPPNDAAGGASDASTVIEAGADAAEAGPADVCAGAVFCDRFERDLVDGDWLNRYVDNGGTLTLDTKTWTSATRSLAMHVPATMSPHAQMSSPKYPNVAHVLVALSMKTGVPDRAMSLLRIQIDVPNRGAVFDLFMLGEHFGVDEQVFGMPAGVYADYAIQSGFKPDVWQRWTLELDARAAPAMGIVTLDGVEKVRTALENTYGRGELGILLGSFYAPDGPVRNVSYDDVSITILP